MVLLKVGLANWWVWSLFSYELGSFLFCRNVWSYMSLLLVFQFIIQFYFSVVGHLQQTPVTLSLGRSGYKWVVADWGWWFWCHGSGVALCLICCVLGVGFPHLSVHVCHVGRVTLVIFLFWLVYPTALALVHAPGFSLCFVSSEQFFKIIFLYHLRLKTTSHSRSWVNRPVCLNCSIYFLGEIPRVALSVSFPCCFYFLFF